MPKNPPAYTRDVWRRIRPYIKVQAHGGGRDGNRRPLTRLEISGDASELFMLVKLTARCAACGKIMNPVRWHQPSTRSRRSSKGTGSTHAYLAVACKKPGCRNTSIVSDTCDRIREAVGWKVGRHPLLPLLGRVSKALLPSDYKFRVAVRDEVLVAIASLSP